MADDAHGIGRPRRRPRLDLRAPAPPPTCRCRWARCRRRSAAMAAISAPRAPVDRADEEPRPHLHLLHRPAARDRSPPPSPRSISSPRDPALAAAPLAKARAFTARAGLPPAASQIVPVIVGAADAALAAARVARSRGIPRGADPPAHGAGRHRAAALCLHRAPRRRRHRKARRSGAHRAWRSPHDRRLRHRHRHRYRQDLRCPRHDPPIARARAHRRGAQAASSPGSIPAPRRQATPAACCWRSATP